MLDSMDLERERGITIKAQTAALALQGARRRDLPAQPDRHARATSTSPTRSRARSRPARARCWSSTRRRASRRRRVANCYTAIEQGVEVVPVLNKIDLPSAEPDARDRGDRGHHRHRRRRTRSAPAPRPAMGVDDILEAVIARIPPPKGDPDGAAAGADHRLLVRQLRRRRDAGARDATARCKPRDKILLMATGARTTAASRSACSRRSRSAATSSSRRRGRLRHRRHQGNRRRAKVGDTDHARAAARRRRRCRASRKSSRRCSPASSRSSRTSTRRCATRWTSCKLNDCVAALRARGLAGAGLRLPLRLPRPAAHGHRAGAARARVRHGPDHHGADRRSTRCCCATARVLEIENPSKLPDLSTRRGDPRADHHRRRS